MEGEEEEEEETVGRRGLDVFLDVEEEMGGWEAEEFLVFPSCCPSPFSFFDESSASGAEFKSFVVLFGWSGLRFLYFRFTIAAAAASAWSELFSWEDKNAEPEAEAETDAATVNEGVNEDEDEDEADGREEEEEVEREGEEAVDG